MKYYGNKDKIDAIVNAVGSVKSAIDIGCNYGYIAKALIENKAVDHCYGMERNAKTVDPELLANPAFTFYEADLTKFKFKLKYDAVIYVAVHHRIFSRYGKRKAMSAWRKIVNACNKTIIFETGVMTEQDEGWPSVLAKHYKNDKEHMDELLSIAGGRLNYVEEILRIPIRGSERSIYRISLSAGG